MDIAQITSRLLDLERRLSLQRSSFVVSDIEPSSPFEGMYWHNSRTSVLYRFSAGKFVPAGSSGKFAKIYGSTNFISTGGAQTQVTGLSTKVTNDTAMTATSDRITITDAGYYVFNATFRWTQPGSAAGDREIAILKNG